MSELTHTIHIRALKHSTYERLWNLRKFHNASSWSELLDKVTEEYAKQIEVDWI